MDDISLEERAPQLLSDYQLDPNLDKTVIMRLLFLSSLHII